MNLIIIAFIVLLLIFPFLRCVLWNIPYEIFYMFYDIIDYFLKKKWKNFANYGIDMFVGMFGHGKTLSMTNYARRLYKKYGDTIQFISNYKLYGIPYVPLVNFNQLLELGREQSEYYTEEELENRQIPDFYYDEDGNIKEEFMDVFDADLSAFTEEEHKYFLENDIPYPDIVKVRRWKYQGYVVLIDEIEDVLSHRNYASFPLQLLNVLTQQRKKHVYIVCSAQRFFMVDKLFRAITTHVIDCHKLWRFQGLKYYDAWDYENAMNPQLVHCQRVKWWFVHNKDFNTYDTTQMIDEDMSANFISNDEKLARIGLDNIVNEKAIGAPSFKLRRSQKRK